MDNMIYILFICVAVPLLLSLFILEKKSRLTMGYILLGMLMCLVVSEINGALLGFFGNDMLYVTTTITPVTEELIKALPVLYYAYVFSDKRDTLLNISFAEGIGFAVLENIIIFANSIGTTSLFWALIRGFGSGLMHGICTVMVGLGISFVKKKRKLFLSGVFALMTFAIIYHATYNCFVQSKYPILGFLLPIVTYVPLLIVLAVQNKKAAKEAAANK